MNTFLPYPSFKDSAKVLDFHRLGKQRIECLQILNCLKIGPYQYNETIQPKKTPWYFHPATQMWKGYEKSLAIYGLYICNEWINRGYKDSCFDKLQLYIPNYIFKEDNYIDYSGLSSLLYPSPKFLGNKDFHLAMQSNLIRKAPDFYKPIFGFDIPENLPYIWRV